MKSATIIQLAKLASKRTDLIIEIDKLGANTRYQVIGFIKVDTETEFQRVGNGASFICFKDTLTDEMYARDCSDFSNFIERVL